VTGPTHWPFRASLWLRWFILHWSSRHARNDLGSVIREAT
jgi:hypothetical protein